MGFGVTVGDADLQQLRAVTNEVDVLVRHPVRWRLLQFACPERKGSGVGLSRWDGHQGSGCATAGHQTDRKMA